MAQTGNDILKQILGVCMQINKKLDKKGGSGDSSGGFLSAVFGKGRAKKAKEGSKIIDAVFGSISGFLKLKPSAKKLDATSKALKGLFETVIWIGENERKAESAISLIDKLGKHLESIRKTAKAMSTVMLAVGGAIVLLAGGVVVAGLLLGTEGVFKTMGAVLLIVGVITGTILLLGKLEKHVDKGSKAAKGMGIAMMLLAGGVVALALGVSAVGNILGAAGPGTIIAGVVGIIGIIGVMAVVFNIMGGFAANIALGSAAAIVMGIGLAALSFGLTSIATAASKITALGDDGRATNKKGEKRGQFGQVMSQIGPGLGAIGIMTVSAALMFAVLGALSVPIILGATTTIVLSGALFILAKATQGIMGIASKLDTPTIKTTIKEMVTGTMGGLLDGVTEVLSGGEKGIKGFAKGIKNTAILMNGIALLMGVSVSLSMFAKALTAFANLDNMRVIKSYDEKTGEPKFGETVNIQGVGETIKSTLTSFLTGLIGATTGLRKRDAAAIKKMGRALTGRRGILSAVIQFADVIKTFAQFGPEGKIGYVEMVPDGTDEDGNAKFKQIAKTVTITEVTGNITSSFSKFTSEMAAGVEGVSRRDKRKLLNMAEALIGKKRGRLSLRSDKPGLLEPINAFSETLLLYAKFGETGMVPDLDAEGNPKSTGVPINRIVRNIVSAISSFSTELVTQLQVPGENVKDAQKRMKGYMGLIDQIGTLGSAAEGLDKTAQSIMSLATSMGSLAESINKFELDKLAAVGEIVKSKNTFGSSISGIQEKVSARREARQEREILEEGTGVKKEPKEIKKNEVQESKRRMAENQMLADSIGSSVAAALVGKQFTFDFQGENKGIFILE